MALILRRLAGGRSVRRAVWVRGVRGDSTFWRAVGVSMLVRRVVTAALVRRPETLARVRIAPDRGMQIRTATPVTGRRARRGA